MTKKMEIEVKITQEQIWGNVDPRESEWDQLESEEVLIGIIDACITGEYPDAMISVETAFTDTILVDGEDETTSEIAQHVNQLVDKAWNGDWMVVAA